MAITSTLCTSFKQELGLALHNFTAGTGNAFKMALYTNAATLGATTTVYSATNEVAGTGYAAGGNSLSNVTPVTYGTTAVYDFQDVTWANSTITARGALIYNSTNGNRAVCTLDFGEDKISIGSVFAVVFPTPDAANAVIRITAP
jgi:hypothetical protein